MGMEFEYDETGNSTQLFLLGALIFYLIPTTVGRLTKGVEEDASKSLKEKSELSSLCTPKFKALESRHAKGNGISIPVWSILYAGAWVALFYVSWQISGHEVEAVYDPYEILGLGHEATEKEIKKAKREMSRIYHPDKNLDDPSTEDVDESEVAAEMFMKITKAHDALTDEVTMENYKKYGNPDGPQSMEFGIALPSWIIDPENSFMIISMYFVVFMVILPVIVGSWWYRKAKLYTDDILLNTMKVFNAYLRDEQPIKTLIERMCWSEEFQQIPVRQQVDQMALPKFLTMFKEDLPDYKKFKFPRLEGINIRPAPAIKSRILLYIHKSRNHDELIHGFGGRASPLLEDLNFCLARVPALIGAMIEMAQMTRKLSLLKSIMQLSQMMIQAVDKRNEEPLLQVPHFTERTVRECGKKKMRVRTIEDLFTMPEEKRNTELLKDFTPIMLDDVKRFGQAFPFLDVSHDLHVKGEDRKEGVSGYVFDTGSTVTVTATLKRRSMNGVTNLGFSQTSSLVADEEDEGLEEASVEKASGIPDKYKKKQKKVLKKKGKKKKKVVPAAVADSGEAAATGAAASGEGEGGADVKAAEFEDDGRDKAKLKEFKRRESFPVHCPLFPELKEEWWWVFMAHSNADQVLSTPICVKTLKDEESVDMMLPMPGQAGDYSIRLFVVSDSYLGIDQEILIPFTCVKGEEVKEEHDPLVEEEDSDALTDDSSSDEDSDF
eukprot:gene2449-33376_t